MIIRIEWAMGMIFKICVSQRELANSHLYQSVMLNDITISSKTVKSSVDIMGPIIIHAVPDKRIPADGEIRNFTFKAFPTI